MFNFHIINGIQCFHPSLTQKTPSHKWALIPKTADLTYREIF